MTIHNKFSHEGKTYTAEPKPYVRIDGALYKVKSDGDGYATIVASGKKDPAPEDVATAIVAPTDPETKPDTAGTSDPVERALDLATLKVKWAEAHDEVERVKAEFAAKLDAATSGLTAAESAIAANLLGRERKRGEAAPAVKLGETQYRAVKDRNGGPPRLSVVPTVATVE